MDTIHLIGAEAVQQAGNRISAAADRMSQAASSIDDSLTRFIRNMDELICRVENASQSFERLAVALERANEEFDVIDDLRSAMIAEASQAPDQVDDTATPQRQHCPGCIDCGPPIVVHGDDRCGETT